MYMIASNDSMGNVEVLKRGDIQLTSAGTGISHSEKAHGDNQVHFLQIWSIPSASRLTPSYFTRYVVTVHAVIYPMS
jgi:redox-sensitive bicupin YhaK (pirin superfamily)